MECPLGGRPLYIFKSNEATPFELLKECSQTVV